MVDLKKIEDASHKFVNLNIQQISHQDYKDIQKFLSFEKADYSKEAAN